MAAPPSVHYEDRDKLEKLIDKLNAADQSEDGRYIRLVLERKTTDADGKVALTLSETLTISEAAQAVNDNSLSIPRLSVLPHPSNGLARIRPLPAPPIKSTNKKINLATNNAGLRDYAELVPDGVALDMGMYETFLETNRGPHISFDEWKVLVDLYKRTPGPSSVDQVKPLSILSSDLELIVDEVLSVSEEAKTYDLSFETFFTVFRQNIASIISTPTVVKEPVGWLDDMVVNCIIAAIHAFEDPDIEKGIVVLDSWFRMTLHANSKKGATKRLLVKASKGVPLSSLKMVVIPHCEGEHWTLLVVKPQERLICLYDPLPSEDTKHYAKYKQWLDGNDKHPEAWRFSREETPRQLDGSSCGVIICYTAAAVILNFAKMQLDPSRALVNAWRRWLVAVIACGGLNDELVAALQRDVAG